MEPTETPLKDRFRYRLILGKFQVVKIEKDQLGVRQMALRMNKDTYLVIPLPPSADVKETDLLTLYTEVLIDAKPEQSSIQ